MTGPLASLATAKVLDDRTLVVSPEDGSVRRALAAYVRRAGGMGGTAAVWTSIPGPPRRPTLVVRLCRGADVLVLGLALPEELLRTAPRGPLRVAVTYGDSLPDLDGDGELVEGVELNAPPLRP